MSNCTRTGSFGRITTVDSARARFVGRDGARMSRAEMNAAKPALTPLPPDLARKGLGAHAGASARMARERAARDAAIAERIAPVLRAQPGRTYNDIAEAVGVPASRVARVLSVHGNLFRSADVLEPCEGRWARRYVLRWYPAGD